MRIRVSTGNKRSLGELEISPRSTLFPSLFYGFLIFRSEPTVRGKHPDVGAGGEERTRPLTPCPRGYARATARRKSAGVRFIFISFFYFIFFLLFRLPLPGIPRPGPRAGVGLGMDHRSAGLMTWRARSGRGAPGPAPRSGAPPGPAGKNERTVGGGGVGRRWGGAFGRGRPGGRVRKKPGRFRRVSGIIAPTSPRRRRPNAADIIEINGTDTVGVRKQAVGRRKTFYATRASGGAS